MEKPAYTEVFIRAMATSKSFDRGVEYLEHRTVRRFEKRGNVVMARVEGTSYQPYRVRVLLNKDGEVDEAECNCPYDWGGWCKHVVVAVLTCHVAQAGAGQGSSVLRRPHRPPEQKRITRLASIPDGKISPAAHVHRALD